MWTKTAQRIRAAQQHWVWTDVLSQLLFTRCALLLAGWFSTSLLPSPDYPDRAAAARGWHFSPYRLLDIWGRWDTGWYFGIVQQGYTVNADHYQTQSNIAFFPFYPYLIKLLLWPLPARLLTPGRLLLVGVLVSNTLLIAALLLLHKLVTALVERDTARRTISYILFFPTGFFLSCFYTESAFLFLSVGAFYAAHRKAWACAGLCGGLMALTRPPGVLVCVPLGWMYLAAIGWRLRSIGKDVLWLLLVPAGLLFFLAYAYHLSGDWLAPVHAQKAWQKVFAMPWTTLLHPFGGSLYLQPIDQILTVVFLAGSLVALYKLPSAGYGLYALLLIAPPLTSGTLVSAARYYVVVFPVFIMLALAGRRVVLDQFIRVSCLSLQIMFMIAWSQFYWLV